MCYVAILLLIVMTNVTRYIFKIINITQVISSWYVMHYLVMKSDSKQYNEMM